MNHENEATLEKSAVSEKRDLLRAFVETFHGPKQNPSYLDEPTLEEEADIT